MVDLFQKVVVVTGCSGGIGSSVCNQLFVYNATIAGICRNADLLSNIIFKECRRDNVFFNADVGKYDSCVKIVNEIHERFKRIDVLINCAGSILPGNFENLNEDEIESLIKNNIHSVIYPVKAVLPIMIKQGSGKIITIGSLGGIIPMPYEAIYSMTKFAVRGFSLSLVKELKDRGIEISLISSGPTKTRMLDKESSDNNSTISFIQKPLHPNKIAKTVISLIEKPKFEVVLPKSMATLSLIVNLFPKLFYKVFSSIEKIGRKRMKLYRDKYLGLNIN
jgi:short-subunit dehydrogenase